MSVDENKKQGFIVLYRSMTEWGWYTDIPAKCLFLHCLLKANHKSKVVHGIKLDPGMFITSLSKLADETGLSIQQVRTAIKKLEKTGELTNDTSNNCSVITVINYIHYQQNNKSLTDDQQMINKSLTNHPQMINNKQQLNNYKQINNDKQVNSFIKENFESVFKEYPNKRFKKKAYESFIELDPDDDLINLIIKDIRHRLKTGDEFISRYSFNFYIDNEMFNEYEEPEPTQQEKDESLLRYLTGGEDDE